MATIEIDATPTPSGLECLVIVARQHGLHLTASQLIHDNLLTGSEVWSLKRLFPARPSLLMGGFESRLP